jgi:hypothetical protein
MRARPASDITESLALLGLGSLGDARELKQAYYAKMRLLHPDCNAADGPNTTAAAVRVNEAYADLLEVRGALCAVRCMLCVLDHRRVVISYGAWSCEAT